MKEEEKPRVVPFFRIQRKDLSFQLDELTPVEKVSLEKENLMLAILDTISDGVVTVDFNMRITSFNQAAERITGFSPQEAIGRPCIEIFCAEGDKNKCLADCIMKKAVKEGKPITLKKNIVRKNGDVLTVSSTAKILYDLNSNPIGGMSTFVDITAFEKLKEEHQERQYVYRNVVGRSAKMMEIYELIESISQTRTNVLILGETGTGKGLIANAIHFSSIYRDGPFVHVNCASLAENLLESELFGHVRGAFTGAIADHQGRLELAQGGTLFLDEISELSSAMQAKLLKVVEEKRFERVGGSKTINADVRILSASNKDLEQAIKNHTFREDLYYRLKVIPIHVPPLRDRVEDIPLLVDHFLQKLNTRTKKNVKGVTSGVIDLFSKYSWPGNVRELENTLEYALIQCNEDYIDLRHLPAGYRILNERNVNDVHTKTNSSSGENHSKRLDLTMLVQTLEKSRWDRNEAARRLNLSRTTLWRMMKKYGLSRSSRNILVK